jgi:hypothetical protein
MRAAISTPRRPVARALALAAALAPGLSAASAAEEDWWSQHLEVHGFLTSRVYGRSPSLDLTEEFQSSSWRSELNLEAELGLYEESDTRLALFGVLRPVYDSVYELNPTLWGDHALGGRLDPGSLGADTARDAKFGRTFPGHGACVHGEFCLGNADTGSLFADEPIPAMIIDDTVFFGVVSPPFRPRGGGSGQDQVGGNADGETYQDYLESGFRVTSARAQLARSLEAANLRAASVGAPPVAPAAAIPVLAEFAVLRGTQALEASLTPIGQTTPFGLPGQASQPLDRPLNAYAGALGSRSSLEQSPFDLNRSEDRLKFDCLDNAHPWCFVRELYAEVEFGDTFVRLGRQQIVWGKTDAFRLQDNINPIDLGYHNVFPELEERRIPQLALDVVHGFGDVGPLQDLSLEFAWVFDRFLPLQFGQCGEPYAYTASCQARADAGAHSLFNFALARADEVPWTFQNTEPGLRLEFRTPRPSVAFSLSAFYSHQDTPVGEFTNLYSVNNPNPAAMLFLQGLGVMPLLGPTIGGVSPGPWSSGFDPWDRSPDGGAFTASAILAEAWRNIFNEVPLAGGGCADATGDVLLDCANSYLPLALPWTASEAVLRYPRVLTLGASADYQVPRSDTILRVELAYDFDRAINDTSDPHGVDSSDVFLASIGIDRPTYIPFLNPTRTAFLTFQTFVEHVIDYDDSGFGDGMVVPESQLISTFLMQNFWRNDSWVLTNFLAYDWNAGALIAGPSFRWVMSNNLFLDFGINLLFGGRDHRHNIRDLCADGSLECLRDPDTWNPGQWQTLNEDLDRFARSPWFARQSFADDFMEDRDEIWMGITWQF